MDGVHWWKRRMRLLTVEFRKNPSTTQIGAKTSPSAQKHQFQCEKAATSSEQGKGQSTSHKPILARLHNPKNSTGCHGKCVSDGQKHDGNEEKGGSQMKVSEMISEILDGIPAFDIAINDLKSHISDKNSAICNDLKTNCEPLRYYHIPKKVTSNL
ncbi:hypothetical protein O181_120988 [Austropuccinia psidii MF-1]|uniref:Uncharacterized protein n=1 Tax=Austropuccinia psidii MF-1 TaxID=1389203 RepID=A0A9Q3KH28_9BASI|nr:hypothetical protein [Austropuccinia psidii MF-1]